MESEWNEARQSLSLPVLSEFSTTTRRLQDLGKIIIKYKTKGHDDDDDEKKLFSLFIALPLRAVPNWLTLSQSSFKSSRHTACSSTISVHKIQVIFGDLRVGSLPRTWKLSSSFSYPYSARVYGGITTKCCVPTRWTYKTISTINF